FFDVRRVLDFEVLPPADSNSQLVLRNNLFVGAERAVGVDGFAFEPRASAAAWIWHPDAGDPLQEAPAGTRYLRKTFELPKEPAAAAVLNVVCDDAFTVWLSGKEVGRGQFFTHRRQVFSFDVTQQLESGPNVLAVEGVNHQGPAGLLVQLTVRIGDKDYE